MTGNLVLVEKQSDDNDPNKVINESVENLSSGYKNYTFPIGIDTLDNPTSGQFVEFRAFKYKRSFNEDISDKNSNYKYTIKLPWPFQGMNFSNVAAYNTFSGLAAMGGLEQAADGLRAGGNLSDVVAGVAKAAAAQKANDVLTDLRNALGGGDTNFQQQFSTVFGLTFNPRAEIAFNGIGLRSYSFDYILVPKNHAENKAIKNIIEQLEFSFYPRYFDNLKLFLDYPDEFTMSFWDASGIKIVGVPYIPDCTIANFSYHINPVSSNKFYSVDGDRWPTSWRLSFTMIENNQLTADDILKLRKGVVGLGSSAHRGIIPGLTGEVEQKGPNAIDPSEPANDGDSVYESIRKRIEDFGGSIGLAIYDIINPSK